MKIVKCIIIFTTSLFLSGYAQTTINLDPSFHNQGGALRLYDETGFDINITLEPDLEGEGGVFWVRGPNSGSAFLVNGLFESGSYIAFGNGPNSSRFYTHLSGNSSAELPNNSISTPEILNEPGATNSIETSVMPINDAVTVLASTTITAPTDGFVLVIAAGELAINHTNGSLSAVNIGVAESSSAIDNGNALYNRIPTTCATGTYTHPANMHGVFSVTAGVSTFYLLGDKIAGADPNMDDATISAIFIPTDYGTVTSNLSQDDISQNGTRGNEIFNPSAITEKLIKQEREKSIADNQERISNEITKLKLLFPQSDGTWNDK